MDGFVWGEHFKENVRPKQTHPHITIFRRLYNSKDKGLRTFSWRLSGRIVAVFSREERERAVELYFTTSMSTKQVVEHLGYPTRQCLERWLHADPRYADVVPKPPIPLGTRRRAVELCLSSMQQKQVAAELGVSTSAVHHWMRLYRAGGMAALEPKRRDAMPQAGTEHDE